MDSDLSSLPPRRSLGVWAALALFMVVFSYLLILLIALGCVLLPYYALTLDPGFQLILLFLVGAAIGVTMIWSLLPRRDKFVPPGPVLERASHPRLFAELDHLASATNEPLPSRVFLVPQANAFVADRGGMMGLGAQRVMGIGLPLIALLSVSEFRAVLAHEFAHYYGGDTRLGPFVYKTRMAMVRTMQNLVSIRVVMRLGVAQVLYRVVLSILQGYWKIFLRVTQLVSRRQEYRADEIACHIAGSRALISGLKKILSANAAFQTYWNTEVLPLLKVGCRPSIAEGFAMFVEAPAISTQIDAALQKSMTQGKTQIYDSHPPLRDRIAAAEQIAASGFPADASSSSQTLFGDMLSEELRLFLSQNVGHENAAKLKVIS